MCSGNSLIAVGLRFLIMTVLTGMRQTDAILIFFPITCRSLLWGIKYDFEVWLAIVKIIKNNNMIKNKKRRLFCPDPMINAA